MNDARGRAGYAPTPPSQLLRAQVLEQAGAPLSRRNRRSLAFFWAGPRRAQRLDELLPLQSAIEDPEDVLFVSPADDRAHGRF